MTPIEEKCQQLLSNGFDCGTPIGAESSLPNGGSYLEYSSGVTIYYHPNTRAFEVHGAILGDYMLQGGAAGNLGYPVSDEQPWNAINGQNVGRMSLYEKGVIYWRQRDSQVFRQAIDNRNLIYWGVDSVESYKKITSTTGGNLLQITGYVPCFKGVYLPRRETNQADFSSLSLLVHEIFTLSNGLTKVLLIDNAHATNNGQLTGNANGKQHALSACRRSEFLISAYSSFIVSNGIKSEGLELPAVLPVFGDIEPGMTFDKDYVEGWIDGFTEYNNGSPVVSCKPGLYISFHGSRPNNTKIIDQVQNPDLLLWAEHPNIPSLNEKNIFDHGYKPLSPTTQVCGVWQFNNYDSRFIVGKQYWIDHDAANSDYFNLFWQGDQSIYLL